MRLPLRQPQTVAPDPSHGNASGEDSTCTSSASQSHAAKARGARTRCICFAACALSGLSAAPLFASPSYGPMAWVALVPLLLALPHLSRFRLLAATLLFGFLWHYSGLFWMNVIHVFYPRFPLNVVMLALIQTGYVLLFTFPAAAALRRAPHWLSPFIIATLWVGYEYTRSLGELAFPWNFIGASQSAWHQILQWCDVFGVYGLSFLVVLGNAGIAGLISRAMQSRVPAPREQVVRDFAAYGAIVALVLVAHLWGGARGRAFAALLLEHDGAGRLQTRTVQPSMPQSEKWEIRMPSTPDARRQELLLKQFERLAALMRKPAATHAELTILPESALVQQYFVYDADLHQNMRKLADELDTDIVFGASNRIPTQDYPRGNSGPLATPDTSTSVSAFTIPRPFRLKQPRSDGGVDISDDVVLCNGAWQVKPQVGLTDRVYNKHRLVPFMEMEPWVVRVFPFIKKVTTLNGYYRQGWEFRPFETAGVKYGTLICFESCFADLSREWARSGAQMLIVMTNDAWLDPEPLIRQGGFWGTLGGLPGLERLTAAGPGQHFLHCVFRAVETRMPVIQAANSGITGVVDPCGRVLQSAGLNSKTCLDSTLTIPKHGSTLYVRFGDWFAGLCLLVLLGSVAACAAKTVNQFRGFLRAGGRLSGGPPCSEAAAAAAGNDRRESRRPPRARQRKISRS